MLKVGMGYMIANNGNDLSEWFDSVEYNTKSSAELRTAMNKKKTEIAKNIEVRLGRVEELCEQYQLTGERLTTLMMEFSNRDHDTMVSFEAQTRADGEELVPAGVIANIVQERRMVKNERVQITKLELVSRNLCETEQFSVSGTGEIKTRPCTHRLDDDELIYLGF